MYSYQSAPNIYCADRGMNNFVQPSVNSYVQTGVNNIIQPAMNNYVQSDVHNYIQPSMNNMVQACWSNAQNPRPINHQMPPVVGTAGNYINNGYQPSWHPGYPNIQPQQQTPFVPQHFQNGFPQQQTAIKYTPLTPEPVTQPVFQPKPCQNSQIMAKRHRAQISFVPIKGGNFKAIVKRKRKRTIFTTEQVEALEDIFKKKQYITREDRQVIVNQLQINDKAVKIWFQNRRLKDKRVPEQIEEDDESAAPAEGVSPNFSKLDYVQSQINEKVDENGLVTLDDGMVKDLQDVIEDYFNKGKPDTPIENVESSSGTDSSPTYYEPISPPSVTSIEDDNATYWTPSEPDESLQRLCDVQSLLAI